MQAGKYGQAGFTYITVLFALVLFAVGLAAIGQAVSAEAQREHEKTLIHAGTEVIDAIHDYYYSSPGNVRTLPKTWDDLLEDKRFVGVHRYLRRIPLEPFSNTFKWGELRDPDGALIGIYSTSNLSPFYKRPVVVGSLTIPASEHYSDWKFKFVPDP